MKTRFVLFGTGWRAEFYMRIAKAIPDLFEIVKVYTHSPDRIAFIESMGFKGTCSIDDALEGNFDAVIVSTGKGDFYSLMCLLKEKGVEVLSETAFLSLSYEEQEELIGMRGYTLEQYQYVPLYRAIINSLDLIGRVDQMSLSALHNHHAAALCRKILNIDDEIPSVIGDDFTSRITKTGYRYGRVTDNSAEEYRRVIRIMRFSDNRLFLDDFSSNQYHSYLIPNRIEIRGDKGLINERGVYFTDDRGYTVHEEFNIFRDSTELNQSLSLSHITLGDRVVFENLFYGVNLNDDEIAIATMLSLYGEGKLAYTIRDGILDARLGALL